MKPQIATEASFAEFIELHEPPLRHALIAQLGGEAGREATAEALLYGLENWERISGMANPVGYLYRVGQRSGWRRPLNYDFGVVHTDSDPWFEPALVPALKRLPTKQRVAVVLRHCSDLAYPEIAELMEISEAAVRKNVERALTTLRKSLEVPDA